MVILYNFPLAVRFNQDCPQFSFDLMHSTPNSNILVQYDLLSMLFYRIDISRKKECTYIFAKKSQSVLSLILHSICVMDMPGLAGLLKGPLV